jgi:hypothetical protein
MVADLSVRWRLPETQGAEHDRWIREQFAGIVAGPKDNDDGTARKPWTANRRRAPRGKKKR